MTVDAKTHTLNRSSVAAVINPYDLYAIEEALRLKEVHGGNVTAITMGPMQAQAALHEALTMGVDEAVHLCDRAFAGSDTWGTSMSLAYAIRKIGSVDLVLCGKQAVDGDTAQVGPGIAAHLDMPQATYVRSIDSVHLDTVPNVMIVERLVEDGYELLELELPALLTVVKEINKPRLPSLKGALEARDKDIVIWTHSDLGICPSQLGLDGSPTRVVEVESVVANKNTKRLDGDLKDIVIELFTDLELIDG